MGGYKPLVPQGEKMGELRQKKVSEKDALKEAEETLDALKGVKEKKEASVESADEKSAQSAAETKVEAKKVKVGKAKHRSSKYKKAFEQVDRNKFYSFDEALELVKKTSYSKFDGSIEVHIGLEKVKKGDTVRGLIQFPHQAGKEVKATVLDEALVEKIFTAKKTEFDILLASPEMMPKIAKIAKILGPQGKMPNPKSGTITNDPQKVIEEIKAGRWEYKADEQGNIHLVIGKVSWDKEKLTENYKVLQHALANRKLRSVTLSATMGPGVKVQL